MYPLTFFFIQNVRLCERTMELWNHNETRNILSDFVFIDRQLGWPTLKCGNVHNCSTKRVFNLENLLYYNTDMNRLVSDLENVLTRLEGLLS